ncbi:MAG TPA: CHAD domain-containing protein [Methyloceanibacter sp.]|nr:CHAD domain-containing protein [Methyloceanibacter sp.]
MSSGFNLDPAVPMSEAVRRVASAEVEAAYAFLASPPERHKGVHDARKCLKRLRSLLALIRPGLPEPVFVSFTKRLRMLARGLAPARDADALLDAVNKLAGEAEGYQDATPIRALRAWLRKRRQAAGRSLETSAASDAARSLLALRPAMANLAIYPNAFGPVAMGLRDSYRSGRKAFARAFASGRDEDFHEWRKTLQHHWRHMQLLTTCWPSELSARVETARALSQILGDDHDIVLLRHLVSAPTMMFASPEDTAAFLKRCRARHKALRREAEARGARLFAERSRPFADRIETYWTTAAQRAEKPVIIVRTGNVVAFGAAGRRAG